ncbi:MAG: universal stress protein [Ilumatobacter sp.]|uniref:universal stress protein n=1 Tax=Ilumatobacter sp. TaxID=1967498 RepID=UPI003C74BB34
MHIMIAVDDTETSIDTIHTARRLFGDDADYTVASIGEPSAYLAAYDPVGVTVFDVETLDVDQATLAAARAGEAAHRAGLDAANIASEVGAPGRQLCELARRLGVDVIVVGYHDRGWLSRLLDPSTHTHLTRHAPCPVLIDRH